MRRTPRNTKARRTWRIGAIFEQPDVSKEIRSDLVHYSRDPGNRTKTSSFRDPENEKRELEGNHLSFPVFVTIRNGKTEFESPNLDFPFFVFVFRGHKERP